MGPLSVLQGFVIEHTVAVALKIGVSDLVLELLTHALGSLRAIQTAGAVPAGTLQALADGADNLLIGIELDFHIGSLFPCVLCYGLIIAGSVPSFCDKVTFMKKSDAFFSVGFQRVEKVFSTR